MDIFKVSKFNTIKLHKLNLYNHHGVQNNIYCPIIKIHAVTSSEAQQLKLHESDYYTTSVGTDSVCDNIDDAIPATPFAMKDEFRVFVLNIYATENFPQLVMFFQQEIHRNEG